MVWSLWLLIVVVCAAGWGWPALPGSTKAYRIIVTPLLGDPDL